jgi:hypothetical protein
MSDQQTPTDDTVIQPAIPVGTGVGKEGEIIPTASEQPSQASEHEVSHEIAPHVQATSEAIELPPDLRQAGVTQSPQDQTIPPITDDQSVPLPLTDDQIGAGLRQKPASSYRWLAEWCVRQLKLIHIHLKNIHGHFVRIND